MPMDVDIFPRALALLKKYFGYKAFRPAQAPVVCSVLAGEDTVAIMPTGAGKSICFQIPALLFPGVTLVLSPLISLMKDQVDALQDAGVPATFINSTLTLEESRERFRGIARGRYKLIYVAPERLETEFFQAVASRIPVSMVAVDEAHCLSQWGHDFRPSYQKIAPFIATLPRRPIVTAFTATATPEVRDDIIRLLDLKTPAVHVTGFDRPNLYFEVRHGEDKRKFIQRYVKAHAGEAGIVYAATRKQVDQLYQNLTKAGIAAGRYHAGLTDEERAKAQDDFLYDNLSVIVATNAFGMGIDKSNVRYVIHASMPKNLEAYYQEAGRAGRDGEPGACILLYAPSDVQTQRYLIEHGTEDEARLRIETQKLQRMVDYCHTPECLRSFILHYFGGAAEEVTCGNCSNCKAGATAVDVTVDAQKVFSCVYRMHERYGITLVAQVLKGSSEQRVKSLHFDELSTYGLFPKKSIQDIKQMIQRFVATDYLALEGAEYPVLHLRPAAYDVLRGKTHVIQHLLPEKPEKAAPKAGAALFEALRDLRKEIAQKEKIAPYLIFSDKTLRSMCEVLPRDEEEFLDVNGVGQTKLQKYGKAFLACIAAHKERT